MKDKLGIIETSNKSYPICFNLNVMEEIQDKYGSITAWGEIVENKDGGEPKIKELKDALMIMINEAIDIKNETEEEKQSFVTEKQVGRLITALGIEKSTEQLQNTVIKSTEVESSKNV